MRGWWYENLSCKMTTFLPAVELVLKMDSGRAGLGEQFDQFHDSRGATMTSKL